VTGAAFTDTIAAIATGTGPAGVGVVRVSGPETFLVADRVLGGRSGAASQAGHTLRRATLRDPQTGETLDDGLAAVFHAPRSLTGENVFEWQGHGGPVTLARVLAAFLSAGARTARPGEFLERAFLNGKLDLSQAEAIADQVSAQTVAAQRVARRQAQGALSREVNAAAAHVREVCALVEASIDFPDEVGEADPAVLEHHLAAAASRITRLVDGALFGRRLRDGLIVVLAGRPNAGKSSLLNALAQTERAIVTPVPGTTRDVVEEAVNLCGLPVRALDTAGLRETNDAVERIGVERARQAIHDADVLVVVLDAEGGSLTPDETGLLHSLAGRPAVVAVNKADAADPAPVFAQAAVLLPAAPAVATSATTGVGIAALARATAGVATGGQSASGAADTVLVTSARHEAALRAALTALDAARNTLAQCLPAELIAVDAHGALRALGEITGETAREDIIAAIFSRFCLGK